MEVQLRNRKIILLLLLILSWSVTQSQTVLDSLQAHQNFIAGDSLLKKGNYEMAIVSYKKSLDYFKKVENWRHHIENLKRISECQLGSGKIQVALSTINKALNVQEEKEVKDEVLRARSLNMKGIIFKRMNKYKEALVLYEEALSIIEKKYGALHFENAEIYASMGQVSDAMGNFEEARNLYTKAIRIYNLPNTEKEYLGETYLNMANSYGRSGFYNKAVPYYKKGIKEKIAIKGKNHPKIASYYYNLGLNYTYLGQEYLALQYQKKGLNILQKLYKEENLEFANFYYAIGYQYAQLNKLDLAEENYQKALELYLSNYGKEHFFTASLISDMGEMYLKKEEYEIALEKYQESFGIKERIFGNDHPRVFDMNKNFGFLKETQKQYQEAYDFYEKRLSKTIHKFGLKNQKTAEAFIDIARVRGLQNEYLTSITNYQKAIIAATQKFKQDTVYANPEPQDYSNINTLLTALYGKANAFLKYADETKQDKDLEFSLSCFYVCDSIINLARNSYLSVQDKILLQQKTNIIYQKAIKTSLKLYQKKERLAYLSKAFYFSEKNKAQLLQEQLRKTNAQNFAKIPQEKLATIEETMYKLARLKSKFKLDSKDADKMSVEMFDLVQKNDSLLKKLEVEYPKYHKLKYDQKIISIAEIQEKINTKTTILEYFVTDDIIYAFILTKNNLKVKKIALDNLREKILKFQNAIVTKDNEVYKKIGYILYQELLQSIPIPQNNENWIVIPDGPLWLLNFDLLLTEKTIEKDPKDFPYLLKKKVISYANSTHLLFAEQFDSYQMQVECLAFSFADSKNILKQNTNQDFVARNKSIDLPGSRKELKAIAKIIDGTYFYNENSTEYNFRKNVKQYGLLHLALHGELDNSNPENSKLYFTPVKDDTHDNYLYNHELYTLEIPAELAVLSACNTGAGKLSKGEGIMSLGRAFQYAGTKSLMLTQWEVSDETTPKLMKYFYTNLKNGMSKPKALQQAKLQSLNSNDIYHSDPFYWGAFYIIGDVNSVNFNTNHLYYVIPLISIGLIVLFIFFYRKLRIG